MARLTGSLCAARCVRLIEISYDDDSESIDKQLAHGLLA